MISPLGIGHDVAWDALLEGAIATRALTRFDASTFPARLAAEVADFEPSAFLSTKRLRWTDRYAQFAIGATRLALDDAAFHVNGNGSEIGVYLGSALGGVACAEEQHDRFREGGLRDVHPIVAISVFGGSATANVSLEFGLTGPTVSNGNSCASGVVAIGDAYRAIARGDIRAALAGGVEAPLAPLAYGAFAIIRAMSTRNDEPERASRPFDRDRDGFVMAEGAAVVLLERYDDAVARGARIYAEIAGYGLASDAHHMSAPRPDGASAATAMRAALNEAALAPGEIEAIGAHGSATALGDRSEAVAFAATFGEGLASIPVVATKGQHGHALGATGAWEVAIAARALLAGTLPASRNFEHDDPDGPRLAMTRENAASRPRTFLKNAAGFGGINAALVVKAVE